MRIWLAVFGVAAAGVLGAGTGAAAAPARVAESARVVRHIEDRASGAVWLLLADPAHPGGPGRLVRQNEAADLTGRQAPVPERAALVIRAGDRVEVEEHTAVVAALLDAVAMEPARAGSSFRVRLRPGGQVVRVIAVAPGRAVMATEAVR